MLKQTTEKSRHYVMSLALRGLNADHLSTALASAIRTTGVPLSAIPIANLHATIAESRFNEKLTSVQIQPSLAHLQGTNNAINNDMLRELGAGFEITNVRFTDQHDWLILELKKKPSIDTLYNAYAQHQTRAQSQSTQAPTFTQFYNSGCEVLHVSIAKGDRELSDNEKQNIVQSLKTELAQKRVTALSFGNLSLDVTYKDYGAHVMASQLLNRATLTPAPAATVRPTAPATAQAQGAGPSIVPQFSRATARPEPTLSVPDIKEAINIILPANERFTKSIGVSHTPEGKVSVSFLASSDASTFQARLSSLGITSYVNHVNQADLNAKGLTDKCYVTFSYSSFEAFLKEPFEEGKRSKKRFA